MLISSCAQKKDINDDIEARNLFRNSASNIIEFTEKIWNATDSTSVDSISSLFEKKMIEINFSFPPQTDLKITEQENDSLFYLLQKFTQIKKEKLQELSKTPTDSIPQD